MRPLLPAVAAALLFAATPATAQEQPERTYRQAQTAAWVGIGTPLIGSTLSLGLYGLGVDDDEAFIPFGMALLVGGPVMSWSANRGVRGLNDMGLEPPDLWADMATASALTYGATLGMAMADVGGDGAIAVMFTALCGSYVFGMAQWMANRRVVRETGFEPIAVGRTAAPVSFALQW